MNRQRLVSGFIYNGVGWVLNAMIAVGLSAIMVRFTGLEQFGRYVFVTTVFAFLAPILNLGAADVLSRFVPEYHSSQHLGRVRWLIVLSMALLLVFDVLIVGLVVGVWVLLEPSNATLVSLVGIWACLNSWQTTLVYALNSHYEQGFTNLVIVLSNLLMLGGMVLVAAWRPSVELLVFVSVLALVPRVLAYGMRLRARLSGASVKPKVSDWKRIRYYAFYAVLIQITAYVVWQTSETFFLGLYRTDSEVAIYRIAYALPQRLLAFVTAVIGSLGVVAATQVHIQDPSRLQLAMRRLLKFQVMLALPICIWIFAWADWILGLLYGQGVQEAIAPMRVLVCLQMIMLFGPAVAIVIRVKEKMRTSLVINLALALLNLVLAALLIPPWGVWGAVLTVGILTVVGAIVFTIWGTRMIGHYVPFRDFGRMAMAGFSMGLVYLLCVPYGTSWWSVLFFSALGCLTYGVGLMLTRSLSNEERRILAQVTAGLTRRQAP